MTVWAPLTGPARALPFASVDTDQLIPARFMSAPRSAGYGGFLLHDHPARDTITGAHILIAGRNFGSGSSREAAVYALVDAGIRAVIAPSFGDIFAANAVNNALLPATVTPSQADGLMAAAPADFTIDLAQRAIITASEIIPFALPDTWQQKLLNGWDDIDLTLAHAPAIATFSKTYQGTKPWSQPNPQGDTSCD